MYDLVAIGNPVYDEIITPYIHTRGRELSGCSTNACLAARKLGASKVALIGCIGRDHEKLFRRYLSSNGIEHSYSKVSEETGGFRLIYNDKGERTLDLLGIAGEILPDDVPRPCLEAEMILLGPILSEIDIDLVKFIRENSDAEIFLDPQGIVREVGSDKRIVNRCDRDTVEEVVGLVDYVKPNEHEAVVMTGSEDPYTSAKTLVEWGAGVGIVTLAERGSILYDGEIFFRIPAYRTMAKDPTGAGDVYAGAFLKKRMDGGSLFDSAFFASAAASIMVEHTGPDFPMVKKHVDERVEILHSY